MSRTEKELQRRVDILVKGLEKENVKQAKNQQNDPDEDMEIEALQELENKKERSNEPEESKEESNSVKGKKKREIKEEQIQKELAEMKVSTLQS